MNRRLLKDFLLHCASEGGNRVIEVGPILRNGRERALVEDGEPPGRT